MAVGVGVSVSGSGWGVEGSWSGEIVFAGVWIYGLLKRFDVLLCRFFVLGWFGGVM